MIPRESIITDGTVVGAGSSPVITGFSEPVAALVVRVQDAPTGTLPTLTFTISEIDPGDGVTVIASTVMQDISEAGVFKGFIPIVSSLVQVSWAVSGAGASFTGVFATLVGRSEVLGQTVGTLSAPVVVASDQELVVVAEGGIQDRRAANILAQVLGQAQDPAGRLRVLLDPIGGAQTLGTVTTVAAVTNQVNMGGNVASTMVWDNMQACWAQTVRGRIT